MSATEPFKTRKIPAVIEMQLSTAVASVQIIRLDWKENVDLVIDPLDHYQLDLCLSARLQGMSVCFPERWGENRFEPVGELILLPPGERIISRSAFSDQTDYYPHASTVLNIDPGLVDTWRQGEPGWTSEQLLAGLDISDQGIYSLMTRVTREALSVAQTPPSAATLKLVELIAHQVGIEISRYFKKSEHFEFKGGLAAWRLRLIDERAQQIGAPPSVQELATLCNISARQLQRGFRVSRSCSIGRHIEHCRIENAKRLLQRGEVIKGVAAILGYASQSSFSYAFRRATGLSPAEFRRLI